MMEMHFFVLMLMLGTGSPAPKPSARAEAQLRTRVETFYKLAVEHKFREMEAMVAPDARDDYYAGDKLNILDYKIEGVQWVEPAKKANVTIVSKVLTRHIRSGDEIDEVPYASHWELIHGVWYWYVPRVSRRVTAFGQMHTDPAKAAQSNMNLKEMIQKGPDMALLMNGLQPEATSIELDQEPGASASVVLTNKLPGTIELLLATPIGTGFTTTLSSESLKAGEQATLTVRSIPGAKREASVGIQVRPTGQNLVIDVHYRKPPR